MMCGCKERHGGGRFDSCLLDALRLGPVFLCWMTGSRCFPLFEGQSWDSSAPSIDDEHEHEHE
jgi:hypothetical protein